METMRFVGNKGQNHHFDLVPNDNCSADTLLKVSHALMSHGVRKIQQQDSTPIVLACTMEASHLVDPAIIGEILHREGVALES